jgi:ankyrin repeat protein
VRTHRGIRPWEPTNLQRPHGSQLRWSRRWGFAAGEESVGVVPCMEEQIPLHDAAAVGDVTTIRRLVAEGADVNVQGAGGEGPLHWAARNGHVDAVQVLVELGADKEASPSADIGARPLHWAALQGHVAVVTTLVELGADIGALTDSGETLYRLASTTVTIMWRGC